MKRKINIDRDNIRFYVNEEIQYKFHGKFINCILFNISESGVLLKTNQVFIKGDIINILINLENNFESLTLKAEVVHVNNQYIGLKFLHLTKNDIYLIREYISEKFNKKFNFYKG